MSTRGRLLGTVLLATLVVASPVDGQFIHGGRSGMTQPINATGTPTRYVTPSRLLSTGRRSYWKEGGALTSLITLIAVNVWVRDVSASQRLLGSLALGGVFFVPGALIGAQFPKD